VKAAKTAKPSAKVDEPNADNKKENADKKAKAANPQKVKMRRMEHLHADINKHRCLCCKKSIISNTEFDAGHVVSESSGTLEIGNLRPICAACNHSMGAHDGLCQTVWVLHWLTRFFK
jgi:hypothetical protein